MYICTHIYACVVSIYGEASFCLTDHKRQFPKPRDAGQVTLKPALSIEANKF